MAKFLKNQVKAISSHKISRQGKPGELVVVQQPVKARVSGRKETRNSSRRLVDPQPIVQLKLEHNGRNIIDYSLGIYFVRASVECIGFNDQESFMSKQRKDKIMTLGGSEPDILRGTTAVAAQFYKGSPYVACCVFDNLSVRFKGDYRLKFDLYEVRTFSESGNVTAPKIIHWEGATAYSRKFTVFTDASFDGLEASPMLNEQLKKAGCKIRTRKPKSSPMAYRVNKQVNNDQYFSPYQYGMSPLQQSPLETPVRHSVSDVFSSAIPFNNSQNHQHQHQHQHSYTPSVSSQMDVFYTPSSAAPAVDCPQQLDLSSLNDMLSYNASSYVLDNQITSNKLDFNIDNLYQQEARQNAVPRSADLYAYGQQNITQQSAAGVADSNEFNKLLSSVNNDPQYSSQNMELFSMNDLEFSF